MGRLIFSEDDYSTAKRDYGVSDRHVTRQAEERARNTGRLNEIVDPAVNPLRRSLVRMDARGDRWEVTVGCPMDIEASCDTTASMGGEVDRTMAVLPEVYAKIAGVLPGYDPQLCLGIFGDCGDPFVLCRPQFEMEAGKIVNYLTKMAPQRGGCGNHGEDPQYAMFARAYLTDAYTNRIGLKGYHFISTDEPCHRQISKSQLKRIFGDEIFENELADMKNKLPNIEQVVADLKAKTHCFALILRDVSYPAETVPSWRELYGKKSVIIIDSMDSYPAVVSAIIGLTEGTLDVVDLHKHLGEYATADLVTQLSNIEIGAQAKLRHNLPHAVPKAGDIFASKGDLWPIEGETADEEPVDEVRYL